MVHNQELIATNTAELMDRLEEDFPDEDVKVIETMTIVVIEGGTDPDDEKGWVNVHWRSSEKEFHKQYGLIAFIMRDMNLPGKRVVDDED